MGKNLNSPVVESASRLELVSSFDVDDSDDGNGFTVVFRVRLVRLVFVVVVAAVVVDVVVVGVVATGMASKESNAKVAKCDSEAIEVDEVSLEAVIAESEVEIYIEFVVNN